MGEQKHSILLVDRDPELTKAVRRKLAKAGLRVVAMHNQREARRLLDTKEFGGLIIDVLMTKMAELDLLVWVRRRWPTLPIVVTSDFESPLIEVLVLKKGANIVVNKLVDTQEIVQFFYSTGVRPMESARFSGTLEDIDIIEYLQFLLLTGKKLVLQITTDDLPTGLIFLCDGEVVHAVCGSQEGEEALYRCLSFEGGRFTNLPWREPDKITVSKASQFLLIEAARIRDETLRTRDLETTAF
ncbi:MAG: response regulator [Desulfomonile tiedjei]|nr:response regulator [Desulfomonile tiedjei]